MWRMRPADRRLRFTKARHKSKTREGKMGQGRLRLRGARVYRHDGDADTPPVADVVVENGAIVAIGDAAAHVPRADGEEALDLSGHLLLPGFVNAHYHSHDVLAKGCFEAKPLDQWGLVAGALANARSLEEVRLRTLVGAIESLRNGATTVQDFSSFTP